VVHEFIYNETSNHSLLSELQLREFGITIDSTCHIYGGTQQMLIQDDSESHTVPLDLQGAWSILNTKSLPLRKLDH
jgi:hypothetical protein